MLKTDASLHQKSGQNPYAKKGVCPSRGKHWNIFTLPETNIAPENQWLEDENLIRGFLFSGAMLVSGRVFISVLNGNKLIFKIHLHQIVLERCVFFLDVLTNYDRSFFIG